MINALRRIASMASITLDHSIDKDDCLSYKWKAKVGDKVFVPTKTFQSFDDCIRSLVETVTPNLPEGN